MEIFYLIVLVIINAFFAASEMAYIVINDTVVKNESMQGNKKALKVQKVLEQPSKFLATIQIGITLAGFLSSAFASTTFAVKLAPVLSQYLKNIPIEVLENISIVLITIVLSYFTLIFGELVPKRLAMKYSKKIAYMSIGVIVVVAKITDPYVKLLSATTNGILKIFGVNHKDEEIVTEEEIKMMINQGEEKGTIKKEEKELLNNVFELNDIAVCEVMKHRREIFAINIEASLKSILEDLEKHAYTHSRIPVYYETIDEIQGVVYVKDILKNVYDDKFSLKDIIKDVYFVSENQTINEVFKEMQKNKRQIAVALDEYGGTAGLITMEDILEELVGDIFDEYDKEELRYKKIDENTYIISGSMTIYDVNKIMNVNIPDGEYDTISGYILQILRKNTR